MPVRYPTNVSSIEEAVEESGRQVALTGVSDNDDDRLSSELWTGDYLTGSLQGPATGDTRDNALFCGSATGEGDGLITGNQQDLVNDGLVEVIRDKARAPALDLVRGLVTLSNDGGLGGLGTEDLDLGILLLEVLASARDGAAGTDTGDDGVDLALGIVPDLSPVRSWWIAGLAGLSNWLARMAPGCSRRSRQPCCWLLARRQRLG